MDYLYPCMLFLWVSYLWETYLEYRQRKVFKSSVKVPEELEKVLDKGTFNKSRAYQLDKSSYSLVRDLFKQLEFLVIIVLGGIPLLWNLAGWLLTYCNFSRDNEVLQSVVFLLVVSLYSLIADTPWTIYYIFVLEEAHGFNKQTWGFFVKDQVKKLILGCVLNSAISAALVAIIKWGGEYFYIYAWLFILAVSLVLIFVYHDFIAPWFDKFRPLPEGELRTAIEFLASSLDFPLKKLLVVEGSKRSAHSNAYFYGFWKNKYIVLFDTLLQEGVMDSAVAGGNGELAAAGDGVGCAGEEERKEEEKAGDECAGVKDEGKEEEKAGDECAGVKDEGKEEEKSGDECAGVKDEGKEEEKAGDECAGVKDEGKEEEKSGDEDARLGEETEKKAKKGCNTSQILGVLAHELGHWKLSHNIKMLLISQFNLLFLLFLFGFFMNQQDMYASFGFPDSRPVFIGLLLFFQLVFSPYNEVMSFLMTQLVRRFEYQADGFAVSLGHSAALAGALICLNQDNLGFPVSDPLYSAFHHSHPTLLERLRALKTKTD